VSSLRQIGVPLARIAMILELPPSQAAADVAAFWSETDADHAARAELARSLVERLSGRTSQMYEVATRAIPERSLLCLERHVDGEQGAWSFGKEFVALLQQRPLPRIEGRAGAAFQIYHGAVTDDSDGPVEWCRPVPADEAVALAARFPELTLRTEPAHEEAFVPLGRVELSAAHWQVVSDTLRAWSAGQDGRRPSDLGVRVTYLASPKPITADSRPDCDLAVPLQ
jgi:hypothetical protein